MVWLTVVFGVIGLLGTCATIVEGARAHRANVARRRLEWADLQSAANDLGRRIRKDCTPAALITPGLTGATFANLLANELRGEPPVFVGVRFWKTGVSSLPSEVLDSGYEIDTNKWRVVVPGESVRAAGGGVILIVDDFVMSGDFLERLTATLLASGVDRESIKSASIAVTKVAIENHKAPDYYWWVVDGNDFYFPWGKAR